MYCDEYSGAISDSIVCFVHQVRTCMRSSSGSARHRNHNLQFVDHNHLFKPSKWSQNGYEVLVVLETRSPLDNRLARWRHINR